MRIDRLKTNNWLAQTLFTKLVLILVAVALPVAANVPAVTYLATFDNSEWKLESSVFACSLSQEIPSYGKGVFYRRAGEKMVFFLQTPYNQMRKGQASLVIEPPSWRPGNPARHMGYVDVVSGDRPFEVEPERASTMLASLNKGYVPMFTRKSWYEPTEPSVRVGLSAFDFDPIYRDFLGCVSHLLPVNFDQIKRSVVFYNSGGLFPDEKYYQLLDYIVMYVKADPAISNIIIDGHTDDIGRRFKNRELSRERAEHITNYFIKAGLAEELITTRYHGERYPVVRNLGKDGRSRNRRVTIRLERDEPFRPSNLEFF
ncbi:flagellar protein MotY [Litoribrevibacter albus]|uniref:Membrane protein n=1 Tax=Litoribrevibacter albus TaxID=1473156 RepID=A0AA37S6Z4_9GAMM|nr:OmpA family protein [Litoribrevibacter albus]GLQ29870.1 membrane protein [Litoribrevibacter albus]